jgi:class 3 adenylate cyclase
MSQVIDDHLPSAREALKLHDWSRAFELLTAADSQASLGAEDLESLGDAAWWIGQPEDSIGARQRAYAGYIETGNEPRAAFMAVQLSREYINRQEMAVADGWFSRAERLLEPRHDSVEYGWLNQLRAFMAVGMGDYEAGVEFGRQAMESGQKFGDRDLQAFGLALQGMALVPQGQIKEGMSLIDEATVAAVGGELGPTATGMIYCMTISICRDLADYRRAGEWTEAARRWCERQSINGFPGVCRVHRAEIMALRGAWPEAEQEARQASTELLRYNMSMHAAIGFYEIGEIRLRMGDLPAAEEAFRQANEMGRVPQPGLAILWSYQGKTEAAAAAIRKALVQERNPLARVRMLPAQVDIAISSDDLPVAREAVVELRRIGETFHSPAIHASERAAAGAVLLAEGKLEEASRELKSAAELWREAEVPYEVARTRVLLAQVGMAGGNREEAQMELEGARSVFEKLGAGLDVQRVSAMLAGDGAQAVRSPGERVTVTFMFTDIVKSTNLVEAIGDEAWEDLIRWHDSTMRTLLAEHSGHEIRHQGDGFAVAFDTPEQAIECAIKTQRTLAEHRRAHGFAPQVRIGMHSAQATRRGRDFAGKGIHEAARIGGLAEGGEILASTSTVAGAASPCRTGVPRSVNLKGIAEAVEVVSIDWR